MDFGNGTLNPFLQRGRILVVTLLECKENVFSSLPLGQVGIILHYLKGFPRWISSANNNKKAQ